VAVTVLVQSLCVLYEGSCVFQLHLENQELACRLEIAFVLKITSIKEQLMHRIRMSGIFDGSGVITDYQTVQIMI